jgi:hypothetical protein
VFEELLFKSVLQEVVDPALAFDVFFGELELDQSILVHHVSYFDVAYDLLLAQFEVGVVDSTHGILSVECVADESQIFVGLQSKILVLVKVIEVQVRIVFIE